jgi:hypothetical protein
MTAIGARRRRRTLIAFVFGLVIALCVPVLSYAAVNLIRNSKEGTCKNCDQPEVSIPPTPLSMLATVNGSGKVTTITVMALSPPDASGVAKGGTFIVVPVGAETSSPTTGERMRVGDVYGSGDAVGLKTAVEGLLGVTISEYAVLDASGTQEFLAPVAPVEVDLTEPVVETAADGSAHELFPVGTQRLDAAQMAQFLMAQAPNQSELDRLERIGAFWTAVSDKIGDGLHPSTPPSTAASGPAPGDTGAAQPAVTDGSGRAATTSTAEATSSPDLESALGQTNGMQAVTEALFNGKTYVYRLSATQSTDASSNPQGDDRLLLDTAEVIYVMAKTAPSATSPSQLAVSFWVRSSLGPAATKEAVSRLAFAGANVLLVTEPTATPPPVSTMEYWDPEDQAEAESKVRQLGTVETVEPTLHVKGINVILTLGENFLKEAGLPSSTSTTGAGGASTTTPATTVAATAVGS